MLGVKIDFLPGIGLVPLQGQALGVEEVAGLGGELDVEALAAVIVAAGWGFDDELLVGVGCGLQVKVVAFAEVFAVDEFAADAAVAELYVFGADADGELSASLEFTSADG